MKHTRNELLRMFVLDAVADDFENLEVITSSVNAFALKCGMDFSLDELLQAVAEVVQMGWVKAYDLSPFAAPREIDGAPSRDEMESSYYWVTEEGARVQGVEDSGWPFDEDGELKPDWCTPE